MENAASNKAVVEHFVHDSMNPSTGQWNLDVIREVFDVDQYFSHSWGAGLAETGARMAEFFAAFEFIETLSEDFVAEGEFVVHRATDRVRHVGETLGIAATHRVLTLQRVEMWRVEDGKIIEHWGGEGDTRSLYDQITSVQ